MQMLRRFMPMTGSGGDANYMFRGMGASPTPPGPTQLPTMTVRARPPEAAPADFTGSMQNYSTQLQNQYANKYGQPPQRPQVFGDPYTNALQMYMQQLQGGMQRRSQT